MLVPQEPTSEGSTCQKAMKRGKCSHIMGRKKGEQRKTPVKVIWQLDEYQTNSVITWYGNKTRREYRLTCFQRSFPYLTTDSVGELLVLVPYPTLRTFRAFLLDLEDDIEEIQAALGVRLSETWAVFRNGEPQEQSEESCIEQRFRKFVEHLTSFPTGGAFSAETRQTLGACIKHFEDATLDASLLRLVESEYRLFRMAERVICQNDIVRLFKDVDDFLKTALTIINRRKSRAGRSLENHVADLLRRKRIPHEVRPKGIKGQPDLLIPSVAAYNDPSYPRASVFVVGVKTTCKDRWRQVIEEAPKVHRKYILTVQPGISTAQLRSMKEADVSLIVPSGLHSLYPRERPAGLIDFEQFVERVERRLPRG